MKKSTFFILFISLNLLFISLVNSQVKINLTGGAGVVVNSKLFGVNVSANVPRLNYSSAPTYPNSGNKYDPWSADETFKPQNFPATLSDIGATSMRYPGGHKTSFWHWDDIWYIPYVDVWGSFISDGGVSTRTTRKQITQWGGNMDLDEYMTQCINLNLEPMIGCNLLAGSRFGKYSTRLASVYAALPYGGDPVAETVAMLQYCKKNYPSKPVNYVFLDNEVGHGVADGTINATGVSYSQYPQMVQDCSVAFKAISPSIKIVTNLDDAPNSVNTKNLITSKGQYIDVVDTHFYYINNNNWNEYSRASWMAQTAENLGGYPTQIRQFYSYCAANGRSNLKLAVNEWNLLSVGPLQVDPTTGAKTYGANDFDQMLVTMDMLMMFIREKVDMASMWSLYYGTSSSSMIIPQQNYKVRTPCLIFKLFKEIQDQTIQNLSSSSTDMLAFAALQNAQSTVAGTTPKLILLLLSKNSIANRSVTLDLGCFKPKSVSGFSYVEDTVTVTDPYNMDGRYKVQTLTPTISNGDIVLNCPGLSITKLTIDLDMKPSQVDGTLNQAPVATNLTVTGTPVAGQTLYGGYSYVDMEGDTQGVSTFRWLRSNSSVFDSTATAIPSATANLYTVNSQDTGKYLFFEVTPVATTGTLKGCPVLYYVNGNVNLSSNHAPVCTNVVVSGSPTVGQILTGSYTFLDLDANTEATSTYRWLRSSTSSYNANSATAIPVATTKQYQIQTADAGKYLFFEVTPIAQSGVTVGLPSVNSTPVLVTSLITSVDSEKNGSNFKVFVDTKQDLLNIQLPAEESSTMEIDIISLDGKLLFRERLTPENYLIQLSLGSCKKGIYLCRIKGINGIHIVKFIK